MAELRDRAGRGEAPRPHGVGLHVGHAGQLAELAGDVLPRRDDEGIGQRIAAERADDFAEPLHRAHVLQRLLARHEAHAVDAPVGAQPRAQRLGVGAPRLRREEQRDARLERKTGAGRAQAFEQRVARGGQRERDADHQGIQHAELSHALRERVHVVAQPGPHTIRPPSRRSTRLP